MTNITHIDPNQTPFDSIRQIDEAGNEYWLARDLQWLLGYTTWQRFNDSIKRAIISCEIAGNPVSDHFLATVLKKDPIEKRGRSAQDYRLSRYACHLVAMNGDVKKPEIAGAQAYFSEKTRERELQEQKELEQQQSELDKKLQIAQSEERKADKDLQRADKELQKAQIEVMPQIVAWRQQGLLSDFGTATVVQQMTGMELNILPPAPAPVYLNEKLVNSQEHMTQEEIAKRYDIRNKKGKISASQAMKFLESIGAGKMNNKFWEVAYDPYGKPVRKFKRSARLELDKLVKKSSRQLNLLDR